MVQKIVAVDTPLTNLIKDRMGPAFQRDRTGPVGMYDQLTLGALIDPSLVKTVDLFVDVDDHPGPSYGVTVGGPKIWEGAEGAKQVSVQYDVDFDRFIRMFVDRVTRK